MLRCRFTGPAEAAVDKAAEAEDDEGEDEDITTNVLRCVLLRGALEIPTGCRQLIDWAPLLLELLLPGLLLPTIPNNEQLRVAEARLLLLFLLQPPWARAQPAAKARPPRMQHNTQTTMAVIRMAAPGSPRTMQALLRDSFLWSPDLELRCSARAEMQIPLKISKI